MNVPENRRKIREGELKKLMELAEDEDLAELTDIQVDNLISVLGRTAANERPVVKRRRRR